ncbi:YndJ family protein [Haloprofundus salinisoli]|uniref:YndJ family protein n=1 Tax=Haloprofundus salinisoli TaxID=2876193 RepID=UPI001CCA4F3E|nr:YndJ family protein [Haloprofundus salinisoli]
MTVAGFLCWAIASALVTISALSLDGPATATLAISLAVFVVVPLVARLADLPFRTGRRSRWYRAASFCSLPSALAAVASLSLPAGSIAALLAVPWFVVTSLLAVFGLQRGFPNTHRPAELAVSVALLYLPVAGLALVAHRADVTFGFGATTMLLTVVHYHYAGCALPAFVGLLGRESGESRTYHVLLAIVLVGPGIIGLGIAFSPMIELVAAGVFGIVVAGVAVYTLVLVSSRDGIGYVFVSVAAVTITISMGVVVAYLATRLTLITLVTFDTMLRGHGWLNAVGFALVGLVGWRVLNPPTEAPLLGMPISQIISNGRVGADYLDRYDLVANGNTTGMVDGFTAFNSSTFESSQIEASVRAFYERTANYDLRIEPTWERGFRLGARLYARLSRRIEQMNFPIDDRDSDKLSSRIIPIGDRADGRENVRAWVRTYDETGAAIYVALYATHRFDDQPYMNIAFPLPYSNLTSVLTVEPLGVADSDGVVLSTKGGGDAGIYVRTPVGPLRIPMNETIRVWVSGMGDAFPEGFDDDGSDLFARHEVTLFGRRFLRLDYRIVEVQ